MDAVNYRFDIRMDIALSWYDERVPDVFKTAELALLAQQASNQQSAEMCLRVGDPLRESKIGLMNIPSEVLNNLTESCVKTSTSPFSSNKGNSCQRPCALGASSLCCDGVWIPDLYFNNVVYFSQDRPVSDEISPLYPPRNSNLSAGVLRVTKVQAQFTTQMNFLNFPFDKQSLKVGLENSNENDGKYYLVASGVMRDQTSAFSTLKRGRTDELPVWAVSSVDLSCTNSSQGAFSSGNFSEQDQNQNDPTISLGPLKSSGSSCSLVINIYRQSQYYVWNALFPMYCSVHLCFLVFFVSPSDLELRMATTITLFLALTALQFTTNDELPTSSYVTAFHKILIVSYVVIAACGVESLFVHHVVTKKEKLNLMGKTLRDRKEKNKEVTGSAFFPREFSVAEEDEITEEIFDGLNTFDTTSSKGESSSLKKDGSESKMKKSASTRALDLLTSNLAVRQVKKLGEVSERFGADSAFGYRIAVITDSVCLVTFVVMFWLATYLILLRNKTH